MVTILILIDGFLQYIKMHYSEKDKKGHNPYFNRWFSAIYHEGDRDWALYESHNPYFNRWFSAILNNTHKRKTKQEVTILILIDGFLQ